MNHLNSILFEGIVSSEPEVKVNGNDRGETLVTFTLANHRYFRDEDSDGESWKERVTFITVKAWGILGNKCLNALHKGTVVRALGRIEISEYTAHDKSGTFSKPYIIANHIEYKNSNEIKEGNTKSF